MPREAVEPPATHLTRNYRTHRQTECEAICFADTRSSQTKIMQNTRRALRPHRNDSTKVTRVIVPVSPPGLAKTRPAWSPPPAITPSSPSSEACAVVMNDSSSSSPPAPAPADSARSTSDATKTDGSSAPAPAADDGEDQEHYDADAAAESALLHFSTPRDPATISALLRTRVYRPGSLIWPQG